MLSVKFDLNQPRDAKGRFTFTGSDIDKLSDRGKRELAKRAQLHLPKYPTIHEIEQALHRAARSTAPVLKEYKSQAQRNLMEACRADPGFSEECPPGDVVDEYHEASRGKMKNKDLPEKVDDKKTKKSLMRL